MAESPDWLQQKLKAIGLRPISNIVDITNFILHETGLAGHTVFIVDRTDRWTQAMGAALTQLIENAQRDTGKYEKFSIVALDAERSVHPLFSVCNPGEPTFWSDLYRGKRFTTRDFEQRFVGAAERVIAQVREPSEAQSSPIVEYVHRWLGSDDFNESVRHRRLILVSDMRQNSSLYSIYASDGGQLSDVVERQFGAAASGVTFVWLPLMSTIAYMSCSTP